MAPAIQILDTVEKQAAAEAAAADEADAAEQGGLAGLVAAAQEGVSSALSWASSSALWLLKKSRGPVWVVSTTALVVVLPLLLSVGKEQDLQAQENQAIQQLKNQGYSEAQARQYLQQQAMGIPPQPGQPGGPADPNAPPQGPQMTVAPR